MPKGPFTFMSRPDIREAARGDAAGLAHLMKELGYPVEPEALWLRIERLASPAHRTFIAEVNGHMAGFAGCSALSIYESDTPVCWIMALSVASHFRRHGVGRELIAAVERWCGEMGLRDIRVHSGEGRHEAHAFYQACGFQHAGSRFKKSLG
ncbi:MAG TPA: GNAT family N-acetyltransferase [Chthoniobacteraceae bacterium]|jgi:GNAT superfamily N-acetyltransferase|nr:GNAT family N-acetyltransferase [Chthoniobacteraceae bacterium]